MIRAAFATVLFAGAPAAATDLVAVAGKAVMVSLPRTPARLFIADAAIASAAVAGTTLLLNGRAAGETGWMASDAAGHVIDAGTLRVRYDEAGLAAALAAMLPASAITLATVRDALVVSGSAASAAEADDAMRLAAHFVPGGEARFLVNRLAISAPVQVNLRVRIAEVSRQVVKALGFNWQAIGGIGNAAIGLATGNPVLAASSFASGGGGFATRANGVDNLFASYRSGSLDLNLLIDALEDEKLVTVLAEPSLMALSGVPASFLAGGEYPIPVPQAQGVTTIEYKRFGVSLAFVATVGAGGRITLNVRPEVSQLTTSGGLQLGGTVVPALTTRRAETTVELGSGQSFAIAGLLQKNADNDIRKFPLLGDLPILGALFRSKRFDSRETELVITVTPTLVRPVLATAIAVPTGTGWRPGAVTIANAAAVDAGAATTHTLPTGDAALVAARRLRDGKPLPLPDSGTAQQ